MRSVNIALHSENCELNNRRFYMANINLFIKSMRSGGGVGLQDTSLPAAHPRSIADSARAASNAAAAFDL